MYGQTGNPIKQIQELVVNDFFTPNVKAEAILDTLLTPYVAEIINQQFNLDTAFAAKEMSIEDEARGDDRGAKIDYILADADAVYLVELKTTNDSIKLKQAENYLQNCMDDKRKEGKTFGDAFGWKLLRIVRKKYTGYNPSSVDGAGGEVQLRKLFDEICTGIKGNTYAERAKKLLRQNGWQSTRKYLYTIVQLLDYLDGNPGRELWNLPLRLFYLTPDGCMPYKDFAQYKTFYKGSASLVEAGRYLSEKKDDALAQMLAGIIGEIYGKEK